MSFYRKEVLRRVLGIPAEIERVAYLVGPVTHFPADPDLEVHRWEQRRSLAALVFEDAWGNPPTFSGERAPFANPGVGSSPDSSS